MPETFSSFWKLGQFAPWLKKMTWRSNYRPSANRPRNNFERWHVCSATKRSSISIISQTPERKAVSESFNTIGELQRFFDSGVAEEGAPYDAAIEGRRKRSIDRARAHVESKGQSFEGVEIIDNIEREREILNKHGQPTSIAESATEKPMDARGRLYTDAEGKPVAYSPHRSEVRGRK